MNKKWVKEDENVTEIAEKLLNTTGEVLLSCEGKYWSNNKGGWIHSRAAKSDQKIHDTVQHEKVVRTVVSEVAVELGSTEGRGGLCQEVGEKELLWDTNKARTEMTIPSVQKEENQTGVWTHKKSTAFLDWSLIKGSNNSSY